MITDRKGEPEPDPELRDQETCHCPRSGSDLRRIQEDPTPRFPTLEYRSAIADHLEKEIRPYVPDAWVDESKTRIGYEIPLTRQFYKYVPPRPLAEIDAEIKQLE
ncbi:MAG: hypothetical protein L0H24_06960, partial [Microlunatus sp.]|nr:hypothetical protein [Microlunatus sp.]